MHKSDFSTTSTDLPQKLIKHISNNNIHPIHVSIYPTNACNQNCPFCGNSERDKTLSLSLDECTKIVSMCKELDTKAISLSGGGEPTMYHHINDLVNLVVVNDIKCAMITNGIALDRLDKRILKNISWIRISVSNHTNLQLLQKWNDFDFCGVYWSLRYISTSKNDNLKPFIDFACKHNRVLYIVPDTWHNSLLPDIPNHPNIFVEDKRDNVVPGAKKCYMGLLKPYIGADGFVYSCCTMGFDGPIMQPQHRLCHHTEYHKVVKEQRCYDGTKPWCSKCFYTNYNKILEILKMEFLNEDFI